MKPLNTIRKFASLRNAIVLLLVGLIFIGIGGYVLVKSPHRGSEETTATIVRLEEEYDEAEDITSYHPYVDYEINGTAYQDVPLSGYSSGMKVGDEIQVYYDPAAPTELYASGDALLPILILIVGLAAAIFGVISLKKAAGQSTATDEYNQVSLEDIDPAKQKEILDSLEPSHTYYFHFQKKFPRQGYDMEDEFKSIVYQANLKKFTLFKPFIFEFVNHRTHISTTRSISHGVAKSVGFGTSENGSFAIPVDNHFEIDGVNNWKYLASHGFGVEYHRKKLGFDFDVFHYGVKVATIETMGTAIFDDDKSGEGNFLKRLPANGLYRVTCRESDLDMVFMTCFSLARAFFTEN